MGTNAGTFPPRLSAVWTRVFPDVAHLLCGALVALLAAGTYIWWIHNYFVADSWALLGSIGAPDWSLADLLPFRQVPHRINSTNYYAPVEFVVLWLAHKGGGYSPELYHLALVAFHVGASLCLYTVAAQLTGSRLKATAAAAIFAVHFANTEAVGWIGGVSHPVAGFFGALALALYTRHLATGAGFWLAAALAALLASALTQVTALPWFAILGLLDVLWATRSGHLGPPLRRLGALSVLLVAVAAVELPAVRLTGGDGYSYHLGVATIRNLFHYPVSTVLPSLEGPSYSLARDLSLAPFDRGALARLLGMTDAYGMLLGAGLAVIAAVLLWAKGEWIGRFALAAFALAIAPAIPLEGQGYRYLYVPVMFFSLGFANGLVDLARRISIRSRAAHLALIAILPLFLLLSFAESQRQLFWWQQAGLIAHSSLQQLQRDEPRLPTGAKVVIGGALDTLPGTNAEVWRNGLAEAIQVIYGDRTLRVESYTRPEVERLFREELKDAPDTFGFLWDNWGFRRIPSSP